MPSLQRTGFVVGLLLIAAVTGVKLVVSVWLKRPGNWMDKALPLVSMVGDLLHHRGDHGPLAERPAERGALADRLVDDS